jgi:hypothetical protein
MCVPDDYATGREAAYVTALFPACTPIRPARTCGWRSAGASTVCRTRSIACSIWAATSAHAVRVHARLGGIATSYKFSRKRYAGTFARVFASTRPTARTCWWGTPPERIHVVGNLAIDGALGEASGAFGDPPSDAARDGILLLPGSRKHEVANIFPMFVRGALNLRRMLPGVPIAFAGSPFVSDDDAARSACARRRARRSRTARVADLLDGEIVAGRALPARARGDASGRVARGWRCRSPAPR